jgi:hypothetical protein
MPELWENCNDASKVVLIQLYWQEHGCYPDFWYIMKGERERTVYEIPVNPPEDIAQFMESNSDIKRWK